MLSKIKEKILIYGKMIKFSHTVFALPFALSAVVMAWRDPSPPHGGSFLDTSWPWWGHDPPPWGLTALLMPP